MSNTNLPMMALVAVGAVVLLNRAKAATAPAGTKSAPVPNTSVNGQLWSAIMGGGWKALTDAKNADGTQAFLKTDGWGNLVTTDGKPVGREYQDLFPATYGNELPVDTTVDGTDYLTAMGFGSY